MIDTPNFEELSRLISAVGLALTEKRAAREALKLERAQVAGLPLTRDDLVADLSGWIDDHVALYREHLAKNIAPLGAKSDRPLPSPRQPRDIGLLTQRDSIGIDRVALLALLGEPIKARLADLVHDLNLPDGAALPRQERARKLAELDSRIAGLDSEIEALERQAGAAGVIPARRQPTAHEIKDAFAGGEPTDEAARQRALENLERRLNDEPDLPPLPVRNVTSPVAIPDDAHDHRRHRLA
jgi:hypothetical protein